MYEADTTDTSGCVRQRLSELLEMQGVRRVVGRHSFENMEEHCNGVGRDNWVRQPLCSNTALELVADTAVVGDPVLPYLPGGTSRNAQKAVLHQLSWQCATNQYE